MLRSVPKENWGEVRIKSAAIEALNKRKPNYGLMRIWNGDYLSTVSEDICLLFRCNGLTQIATRKIMEKLFFK